MRADNPDVLVCRGGTDRTGCYAGSGPLWNNRTVSSAMTVEQKALGGTRPSFYLTRPDRYVMVRSNLNDAVAAASHCKAAFDRPEWDAPPASGAVEILLRRSG